MCRKWQSLLSLSLSLHIYTSHWLPHQNCDRAHVSNFISTFENVHHWQKMTSWSAFGCCDKTLTKDNLGEEMGVFGFYFSSVVSPSSARTRVGTGAETMEGWRDLGLLSSFSGSYTLSVITQGSPNCPGMALTKQLEIRKKLPEIPQASMIKTSPQLRSALIGYVPNQYQPTQAGMASGTWKRCNTAPIYNLMSRRGISETRKGEKNSQLWQVERGWPHSTTFQSQR